MRENFKKYIFIWIMAILIGLGLGAFISNRVLDYYRTRPYEPPDVWVLSQGLNSTLLKQELLKKEAEGGQVTLADIAKVATASTTLKAEAIRVGNRYLLSTGANGQAFVELPSGRYKLNIIPVPGIDFTGVPERIFVNQGFTILNIGITKGTGEIKHKDQDITEVSSGKSSVTVVLYQDKDSDGQKGDDESQLPWAGIVVSIERD